MLEDANERAFGVAKFGRELGGLTDHFLLLDSARGISSRLAQQRIQQWLVEVYGGREHDQEFGWTSVGCYPPWTTGRWLGFCIE